MSFVLTAWNGLQAALDVKFPQTEVAIVVMNETKLCTAVDGGNA